MLAPTAFTRLIPVSLPIALAPMGGVSGGALAAAVSAAGGLGLVGGARGHRDWLERELTIVTRRCAEGGLPWGIGFLTWAADVATVEWALTWRPHAVLLSFGDPVPFAARVRDAGIPLIIQVTSLAEAHQAVAAGADVIVAQGGEAGGHGGGRATLPFVPAVVDLAAPRPVLAAGGIADGRGLAADTGAQDAYRAAARRHDLDAVSVWAGEGLDLITSLEPAADLVARIAREAETALRGVAPLA
jgi:nitronate monooxygenase